MSYSSKKLAQYYTKSALIFLNSFILFLLFNFVLFFVFGIKDYFSKQNNPVSVKYHQSLRDLYPQHTEEQINELLNETWSRVYVYEPFTQFKERPYTGKYVNVDENGFRHTRNQGPWPPAPNNLNVFLFGGSTTFNYGVSDEETIASYLQQFLSEGSGKEVRVYNFGRGYYYSTQERILFEQLLTSGFIPDMAVFIDGLNDFYHYRDEPLFTHRFQKILEGKQPPQVPSFLRKLPVYRVIRSLRYRVARIMPRDGGETPENEAKYNNPTIIANIIARYTRNKKMIEAVSIAYDVTPIFVWQPIPFYKYDLKYHLFYRESFGRHAYSKFGYPKVAELAKQNFWGDNFLWCADIQEGIREPLYVDMFHYSAKMSRKLANCIFQLMMEKKLLLLKK